MYIHRPVSLLTGAEAKLRTLQMEKAGVEESVEEMRLAMERREEQWVEEREGIRRELALRESHWEVAAQEATKKVNSAVGVREAQWEEEKEEVRLERRQLQYSQSVRPNFGLTRWR